MPTDAGGVNTIFLGARRTDIIMKHVFREESSIVGRIHAYFTALGKAQVGDRTAKRRTGPPLPTPRQIAQIINAAFWASLRQEEGHRTIVTLAFLSPDRAARRFSFASPIPLKPKALAKLAPAVERPGVHLEVWPDARGDLAVWGASIGVPARCFVLEVADPGVLVVKHRSGGVGAKFVNVAVIAGEEAKFIRDQAGHFVRCQTLVEGLLAEAFGNQLGRRLSPASVFVELALSMRAHRRGGTLLVVPSAHDGWRNSIVAPVVYATDRPFDELRRRAADLVDGAATKKPRAQFARAVDAVAGLTAVDGATVMTDALEVVGFGAKIAMRESDGILDSVLVLEPVEGAAPVREHPSALGGTRHLSAAQFVHDQRDSIAFVASQDGRFTVFSWSPCDGVVCARRIEVLLL